jgi:membrane protein insertase Oxa1/YidC/SpoIIIJ
MPFLIVLYTLIRGLSTTVTRGHYYTGLNGVYQKCTQAVCGAPRYIPTSSQMHTNLVLSKGQMHWWFGMDLSSYPLSNHTSPGSASQAVLLIPYIALILGAVFLQYYQMKQMNSRNPQAAAANPQMQTMQKFFPIIFGFIYLRVPAGATIYMVVSSAMRIGTQEVMFKTGMVEPVAVEREIGSGKQDKAPPPKPEPKPTKRSTATDGTALAKGTAPPKKAGSNGRSNTDANGRKPAAGKRPANGKGAAAEDPPAPKQPQNRSRAKRARKAR